MGTLPVRYACTLVVYIERFESFRKVSASRMMHPIRIGSCGWSYGDWSGVFYPKGLAASDFLPYYSERFGIVEVDSTFYASPRPSMVQGWREKTPDGFQFSLKVP